MARSRRSKAELTESWDDVDADEEFKDDIYGQEDEKEELGSSYASTRSSARSKILTPDENQDDVSPEAVRNAMRNSRSSILKEREREQIRPSKRSARDSELVMPPSPNAARTRASGNDRASTPHFRLNQRSLTSDAGELRRRAANSRLQREVELDEEIDESSDLNWPFILWRRILRPVLGYIMDVLLLAINSPIVKYGLAIWLIAGVIMLANNFVNNTINTALSPICRIPGASFLNLPFCPSSSTPELSGPAEFDKLVQAQSKFQDVLETTAVGANLPLDMKRSEASIRDLKHVVQYSTLPSRNELVFEFGGFIDTARQASQDLSKFNSRIGRAVDHILSTNRWTLQVIEGVSATEASSGSVTKWMSENLNIFAPFKPVALSRDLLVDQYLRHTSAVEEQVLSLIDEAHALLNILDNLDGRLDTIAGIATRDDVKIEGNKEELFAMLWTKLGGNRSSVAKLERQLSLLRQVGEYRKLAWAHVMGTIVKLQAIRNDLEDLRERVALPETVGDKIPLEVHIDNINLGIERLEEQRDASRKLEAENYARIIGKAEASDRMIGGKEL